MADRILIDRAVVQQALSLCESVQGLCTDDEDGSTVWCQELIEALRAALAQAEPKCKRAIVRAAAEIGKGMK